jgi:hypothetical protein
VVSDARLKRNKESSLQIRHLKPPTH